MTDDQVNKLAETILQGVSKNRGISGYNLNWNNIVQALILASAIYVASKFGEMNNDNIMSAQVINQMQKDINEMKDDFKDFSNKPRYTQENANSDLLPLKNQININANEVKLLESDFSKIKNQQQQVDLEISLLKSKIEKGP